MDYKELGKRIRQARGDLSLRDFAKNCGISHTHLDSIEKGCDPRTGKPVSVSMTTLAKISAATRLSIDYLMGEVDKPEFINPPMPELQGTVYEGLNDEQLDLLLFAVYMDRIKKSHPNMTDEEQKKYIADYHNHDAVETFIKIISLNSEKKATVENMIDFLSSNSSDKEGE